MKYLVVIERGPENFGAYVPDLPGCVAVGATREEVSMLIHEAIEFHIEGLKQDGLPVPVPSSTPELIEVDAQRVRSLAASSGVISGPTPRSATWTMCAPV